MIATSLITTFHCVPIAPNWDPASYLNAKRVNFADFITATACVSIFTDILVLICPHGWYKIFTFHGSRSRCLSASCPSVLLILLDDYDRHIPEDYSYSALFCVSTIEVGLAFVAACAPSLKPLFAKLLPKMFSSKSRSGPPCSQGEGTSGRLGYAMGPLSRSQKAQHEANVMRGEPGNDDEAYSAGSGDKYGIMMTIEMEVKWHNSKSRPPENEENSTESQVQPRR
ncbi:hypothetical protein BBP40_011604 [Aspergillus hancockii]|nr:hypothetical protein BBP40_011604 [Aspergillus hancockii]